MHIYIYSTWNNNSFLSKEKKIETKNLNRRGFQNLYTHPFFEGKPLIYNPFENFQLFLSLFSSRLSLTLKFVAFIIYNFPLFLPYMTKKGNKKIFAKQIPIFSFCKRENSLLYLNNCIYDNFFHNEKLNKLKKK